MHATARTRPSLASAMETLSNPRRRHIVQLIWNRERAAGEIAAAFDVSWPAISQNLRVLKATGLIRERRDGTRRLYKADREALGPLAQVLTAMWERDVGLLKAAAEREARSRPRLRTPGKRAGRRG